MNLWTHEQINATIDKYDGLTDAGAVKLFRAVYEWADKQPPTDETATIINCEALEVLWTARRKQLGRGVGATS